jgi:adenine-specific DNA-methyltransferase
LSVDRVTGVTQELGGREIGGRGSDPKSMAGRPKEKSKLLGQVFTPVPIAEQMVKAILGDRQDRTLKILDPCVGPCTFPLAAASDGLLRPSDTVSTIDVDPEMVHICEERAAEQGINLYPLVGDYLDAPMNGEYDCAVLNPPYIRQEWIDKKFYYQELFKQRYGVAVPGTSNLYVYFVVKVLEDLKPGGRFSCIIYDSWQSTLYGRWLLDYMKSRCQSLQVETKAGQPFHGRLIDATVVTGVKAHVSSGERVKDGPDESAAAVTRSLLSGVEGFCPIKSIFPSRRGLRLKQAYFFLCDLGDCKEIGATPFLKKIGRLKGYSVPQDHPEAALLITLGDDNARMVAAGPCPWRSSTPSTPCRPRRGAQRVRRTPRSASGA